jgi:hypothetical protein
MGTTLIQTLTQPLLPLWPSTAESAHLTPVGFLAVEGAPIGNDTGADGDFSHRERSRTNDCVIRLQPSTDAVYGTGVSAAQGSQKPVFAPMGALASGVPPRSRPV